MKVKMESVFCVLATQRFIYSAKKGTQTTFFGNKKKILKNIQVSVLEKNPERKQVLFFVILNIKV